MEKKKKWNLTLSLSLPFAKTPQTTERAYVPLLLSSLSLSSPFSSGASRRPFLFFFSGGEKRFRVAEQSLLYHETKETSVV
jgi:hypothetical protein